eukprot:2198481-Pleurochrysis_carterae.AAC.4
MANAPPSLPSSPPPMDADGESSKQETTRLSKLPERHELAAGEGGEEEAYLDDTNATNNDLTTLARPLPPVTEFRTRISAVQLRSQIPEIYACTHTRSVLNVAFAENTSLKPRQSRCRCGRCGRMSDSGCCAQMRDVRLLYLFTVLLWCNFTK